MIFRFVNSLLILLVFTFAAVNAQTVETTIDLSDEDSKYLTIELKIPSVDVDKLNYNFLAGDFNRNDVFNYISSIEIYDSLENEIPFLIWEDQYVIIKEAQKVHTIKYKVEKRKLIFLNNGFHPSQFVLKEKCYYLYPFYFIGYFDQYPDWAYELNVKYPENLMSLNTEDNEQSSSIQMADFNDFFNYPILGSDFDTLSFENHGISVTLRLFQEERRIHINQIRQVVLPIIKDFKLAVDTFALPEYNMAFCFLEDENFNFGGLFHGADNLFLFPANNKFIFQIPVIQKTVAHELMHTLSPLHLHSDVYGENTFFTSNKTFSQHQWLYEGVTDFLSIQMLSKNNRISKKQVVKELSRKIKFNNRLREHSLTEISRNILKAKNRRYQKTFYNKGFLVAMYMDILLKENSNNEFGLLDLMLSLSYQYGKEKPFDEEMFLSQLAENHPELENVIQEYIIGKTPVPIEEILNKIGLTYDVNRVEALGNASIDQAEFYESIF